MLFAQKVYQIRADSVRIYNVCDTAELILENRTQKIDGFLFNKGAGRTEFRKLKLETVGASRIAIVGQDTLDLSALPGIGSGIDSIYSFEDSIKYMKMGKVYTFPSPEPFKFIPDGTTAPFTSFRPGAITGFWAYQVPDMPPVSDQAQINPGTLKDYYIGHVIRFGDAGYQMAVNWDGELYGPKGAFLRIADDTKKEWGAWRELLFKDYADGKYATNISLSTAGTSQINWENIFNKPAIAPGGETLQSVTARGSSTDYLLQMPGVKFSNSTAGLTLSSPDAYLNIQNGYGTTQIGAGNAQFSHFFTTLPEFYFAKPVVCGGSLKFLENRGSFDGSFLNLHHGDRNGIRFWDGQDYYSISMAYADNMAAITPSWRRLTTEPGNDFNMYFRMQWNNRGFVFITGDEQPKVQIDNHGLWIAGNNGLFFADFGGGFYMEDPTWIRTYGNKSFYVPNGGILRTDGTLQVGDNGSKLNVPLNGAPTIDGFQIYHTGNLPPNSTTSIANNLVQRDANANIFANGFYQSSKASLKRNITDFNEPALPLLNNVKIKQFFYKDDKEDNLHVGIIADSTDWHFSTRAHDRFDTNSSLAITMKAVQELSKQNDELRNQNSALKAQVETFRRTQTEIMKRLEALEKQHQL